MAALLTRMSSAFPSSPRARPEERVDVAGGAELGAEGEGASAGCFEWEATVAAAAASSRP